jgi:hypothetical protein
MCNWIYTITRCCYCNAESITNLSKLNCNLLAELVSFYNEIGGAEPDEADCPLGINLCLNPVVEHLCCRRSCKPTLSQRHGRGIVRLGRPLSICIPPEANLNAIVLVAGHEAISLASLKDAIRRRSRQHLVQHEVV